MTKSLENHPTLRSTKSLFGENVMTYGTILIPNQWSYLIPYKINTPSCCVIPARNSLLLRKINNPGVSDHFGP